MTREAWKAEEVRKPRVVGGQDRMQVAMRTYMVLGQCLGLLPVRGILSDDPKDLVFTWKAKRIKYAACALAIVTTSYVLHIYSSVWLYGMDYNSVEQIVNGALTVTPMVICQLQARSWPQLMVDWARLEQRIKYFAPPIGMTRRVNLFVFWFLLGAMFLGLARTMRPMEAVKECSEDVWVLIQLVLILRYFPVFSFIGYSNFKGMISLVLFIHFVLLTVHDELTITVLSYCIYRRFKQFNHHLSTLNHQMVPNEYWAEMREVFNGLSELTKRLDRHLSFLTVFCFGSNLYHICYLLMRTLRDNKTLSNWFIGYIFMFVVVRTFTAGLMAASVHEESKKPLAVLFSVPSGSYDLEVSRLQLQMAHDDIAITGCNFFSVTRSFMLTVAGTIATYEIVMFGPFTETIESANNTRFTCSEVAGTIATYEIVLLQFGTFTETIDAANNTSVICSELMAILQ